VGIEKTNSSQNRIRPTSPHRGGGGGEAYRSRLRHIRSFWREKNSDSPIRTGKEFGDGCKKGQRHARQRVGAVFTMRGAVFVGGGGGKVQFLKCTPSLQEPASYSKCGGFGGHIDDVVQIQSPGRGEREVVERKNNTTGGGRQDAEIPSGKEYPQRSDRYNFGGERRGGSDQ